MTWTTMEKIKGIVGITVLHICPMFPDNSSYRYNHIWIETRNTTLISIFENARFGLAPKLTLVPK